MLRRLGRLAGIFAGLVVGLGGCGNGNSPRPPAVCADGATALEQALGAAPGPVRLAGGTLISECVARALSFAQLTAVGGLLISEADRLAARGLADPAAALELGYLVGATRRGAVRTNGAAGQLQQRIESAAALRGAGPAPLAALHRGIVAGRQSG